MTPLRVVQVCRTGWPALGGLEASVGGLSRALALRGHEVRVVTLDRDSTGRPLPDGEIDGVRYQRLRRLGPRRYPTAAGLIGAVRGAELVHVHGLDGLADQLVARRHAVGAPIGISTHGGYWHTDRHRVLKALVLRTVTRRTLARADAVWFTSASDRARLAPASARGEVLPDGVDVARFSGVERRPEPGRWVVPGRLDLHKGLFELIDALVVLGRVDPRPFRVEIVGRERVPGLTDRLRAAIGRAGLDERVHLRGELDGAALLDALARAELALFPSRAEGFGIAVVEAMAAGVPVVVSDIPAHREHVGAEERGWLADFGSPTAAAAALRRARGDDAEARTAAARAYAATLAWPAVAARYEAAYRALVAR